MRTSRSRFYAAPVMVACSPTRQRPTRHVRGSPPPGPLPRVREQGSHLAVLLEPLSSSCCISGVQTASDSRMYQEPAGTAGVAHLLPQLGLATNAVQRLQRATPWPACAPGRPGAYPTRLCTDTSIAWARCAGVGRSQPRALRRRRHADPALQGDASPGRLYSLPAGDRPLPAGTSGSTRGPVHRRDGTSRI